MGIIMLFLLLAAAAVFMLLVWLLKYLWNTTIPDVFNLGEIRYWQAFRLTLIVAILFGGIRLGGMITESGNSPPGMVLQGVVTDAKTGQPVPGARVFDDGYAGGRQGTTTDADGRYSYLTWCEEHGIKAEAPGYAPLRKTMMTTFWQTENQKVMNFELVPE